MNNILKGYPQPKNPRYLTKNFRNLNDRITAYKKDIRFYNGSRSTGYGGFKDDGRWKKIAENCIDLYKLKKRSKVLHLNCDYGFLINEIKMINHEIDVYGSEYSKYAYKKIPKKLKKNVYLDDPRNIEFPNNFFDLVIGLSVIYTFNIPDCINLLKKISKISKNNNSFITLAAYRTKAEYELFNNWTLLGNLCLKRKEWFAIMKEANYKGDYLFIDSNYLSLKFK